MTPAQHTAVRLVATLRPMMRYCMGCGARLAEECVEPDPCLGVLDIPNLQDDAPDGPHGDACCGHGFDAAAYVCIEGYPNARWLIGEEAIALFRSQGKGPPQ